MTPPSRRTPIWLMIALAVTGLLLLACLMLFLLALLR
jgi:hypothetical protein